jgi:hypothetical protein
MDRRLSEGGGGSGDDYDYDYDDKKHRVITKLNNFLRKGRS